MIFKDESQYIHQIAETALNFLSTRAFLCYCLLALTELSVIKNIMASQKCTFVKFCILADWILFDLCG